MRIAACLLAAALPAAAHVMSMSTGDLRVEGNRAVYELRMPLYEMPHVPDPERSLFAHIGFASGGSQGRASGMQCRTDPQDSLYICSANYEFPQPVESLDVECTLYKVTVQNHVHLLRAQMGEKRDQAILDFSFPRAEIRFAPPSGAQVAVEQTAAGFWRALAGAAQVLFLASLALAARQRRELLALAAMFLAGQTIAALAVPFTPWQPAPRFVEVAMALTIAYLAVEILLLPEAGSRWIVAGVLGAVHGLYFDLFLRITGFPPGFVLAGAAAADLIVLALFAWLFRHLKRLAKAFKPVPVAASALLVTGLVWFFVRVKG